MLPSTASVVATADQVQQLQDQMHQVLDAVQLPSEADALRNSVQRNRPAFAAVRPEDNIRGKPAISKQ